MAVSLVPDGPVEPTPPDFSDRRAGRKRGVQNIYTRHAKDKVAATFAKIGGVPALAAWAKENPTEFYTKIWAKLIPLQVSGEGGGPVQVQHNFEIRWGDQVVRF